jgi:hypothetical protein
MTEDSNIAAQLAALIHAPAPYLAGAILVSAATWAVSRTLTKDAMAALRERLYLSEDRLVRLSEEAEALRRKLVESSKQPRRDAPLAQAKPATIRASIRATRPAARKQRAFIPLGMTIPRRLAIPHGAMKIDRCSSSGPPSRPDAIR